MADRKSDSVLPTLDDLFSTQEERDDARLEKIRDIPLDLIDDFPDHPFHVRDDEDMLQLVESIKTNGVLTPAVLRQKEDGRYELVSGHRRKRACELAGLTTLRSEIKDLTRDEAVVYMVESNFQRTTILPSEKAFAYKMRNEAIKRQGERTDLTSSPLGIKLSGKQSLDVISQESGDSRNQIHRYIRLTFLVPELLELVDEGRIKMRPAVELSYLDEDIRILKECEFDNRFATPEEQQVLAQYVGWGGIPEAFDENNTAWSDEFTELYGILSPKEYQSARESTLTAFYTPPVVISAIYKAMEQMGFKEGNILEPSCGIGNFIGMLPQSMENSRVYGVEIDKISAGIAQQLYQRSSIAGQPFEEANIPDSFFDAVVGNVPFGDFSVADKRYDKNHFLIHDYFFAKSLDKLRPGGVMALVTSKGTMDKENPAVRKYIAQRAELLGAIRLPNNTFKGNAGTEVVSDILILQKRDRIIDIEPDWVHLNTDENGIRMNSYFVEHPDMVLGDMKMVSGRFGEEATCVPYENADLAALLDEAVSNIHGEINEYEQDEELEEEDYSIPADPNVRNFSYTLLDDVIYFRENSRMSPVDMSATAENRIKGLIEIRNSVRHFRDICSMKPLLRTACSTSMLGLPRSAKP